MLSAGDPQGERVTRVAYDNACGLSRYIMTRDPQAAKSVLLIHDRYRRTKPGYPAPPPHIAFRPPSSSSQIKCRCSAFLIAIRFHQPTHLKCGPALKEVSSTEGGSSSNTSIAGASWAAFASDRVGKTADVIITALRIEIFIAKAVNLKRILDRSALLSGMLTLEASIATVRVGGGGC